MTEKPEYAGPKQDGRWQRGQSGNPKGKPKGARHATVQALDLLGRNSGEEILLAIIRSAISGDARSAELVLRRIWPEQKGRPLFLDLPAISDSSSMLAALARIIEAAASGEITTDEGAGLAGLVEAQRRAIETGELAERIAALEVRK